MQIMWSEKEEKEIKQQSLYDVEKKEKEVNFTEEFKNYIKELYLEELTPEEIFSYIYAVLYAPAYRTKYQEYLIIDFPKIPFTKDRNIFNKLSVLGDKLIENHLLKRGYPKNEMPVFAVEGDNKVDKYFYEENKQRLYINKTQYFEQFPETVWEYEIGGYQVFDKYLKERKKHKVNLSYKDISHLKNVAVSIKKTIEIQEAIDNLCSTWI